MDWNKKVYPKDVWNWLNALLPKIPKLPKINIKKKFTRKTKIVNVPDKPPPSSNRRFRSVAPSGKSSSVRTREFVNDIERSFTKTEKRFFNASMKKLDSSMKKLDREVNKIDLMKDFDFDFDVWDTRK